MSGERSATVARDVWRRLEPIHSVVYFAPEAAGAFTDAGYRGFWMGYFAGRAAPLGPVGPEVVEALFYNFAGERVGRALPDAWSIAGPGAALAARRAGAGAALRRVLAPFLDGPELAEAADLAAAAARSRSARGGRCSRRTPRSTGPTTRSTCSGTRRRCCASTAATATSRSCSPTG